MQFQILKVKNAYQLVIINNYNITKNQKRNSQENITMIIISKIQKNIECAKFLNRINNIIIVGDYNQNIANNKMQSFYNKLGVKNVYQHYNSLALN